MPEQHKLVSRRNLIRLAQYTEAYALADYWEGRNPLPKPVDVACDMDHLLDDAILHARHIGYPICNEGTK